MSFYLEPGNALVCKVNSHRHGWNGSICSQAGSWRCGAPQDFREERCELGDDRCFHVYLFSERDPHFVIEDKGGSWVLGDDIHALDDQVLTFWGLSFSEPQGIREAHPVQKHIFGAYRVRNVERRMRGSRTEWVVRPHADGWARFSGLKMELPYFQSTGGLYIQQLGKSTVLRAFNDASEKTATRGFTWPDPADGKRFHSFCENLPDWLEAAGRKAERFAPRAAAPSQSTIDRALSKAPPNLPMRGLGSLVAARAPEPVAPAVEKRVDKPDRPKESRVFTGIVEHSRAAEIARQYGDDVLTALRVGSLTKPILILRGNPGVGKSTLAVSLIEDRDPVHPRTLIVPVSSTWRGREDLLGYVNPISNEFEPTHFTDFLRAAELAWKAGDKNPRVVVFEEFNLSQPEHWMSDILVRSQFSDDKSRVIDLGGKSVRGWPKDTPSQVFLSPAVRFIATINADHTGRFLSPRVVDRAAVIELTMSAKQALAMETMNLSSEHVDAIAELDVIIRDKGASFSRRTSKSLKACLENANALGLDTWGVLDLVLLQEVLSNVRLNAVDPSDHELCSGLMQWCDGAGQKLLACVREINDWKEKLDANQDVQKI